MTHEHVMFYDWEATYRWSGQSYGFRVPLGAFCPWYVRWWWRLNGYSVHRTCIPLVDGQRGGRPRKDAA